MQTFKVTQVCPTNALIYIQRLQAQKWNTNVWPVTFLRVSPECASDIIVVCPEATGQASWIFPKSICPARGLRYSPSRDWHSTCAEGTVPEEERRVSSARSFLKFAPLELLAKYPTEWPQTPSPPHLQRALKALCGQI